MADKSSTSQTFKYYAFDWDDNIVHMPTEIFLLDNNDEVVTMTTADYAKYREKIGKQPFEYNGKTIKDYAPTPFRNFRQAGDSKFLKDAMGAKPDEKAHRKIRDRPGSIRAANDANANLG